VLAHACARVLRPEGPEVRAGMLAQGGDGAVPPGGVVSTQSMRLLLLPLLLALQVSACRREAPPPAPSAATAEARPRMPAEPMPAAHAEWLTREEREREEQPELMLDALGLRPGMRVADVGAGVGYHTVRLAKRVGPAGHVWATDIQEGMLAQLRRRVEAAGLTNVTAVHTRPDETGLPEGQLDLVLMVDVFHEVAEPEALLAKLARALAPGGRLALVEFRAEDPAVPVRPAHKMSAAQVDAELADAGFLRAGRFDGLPRQHLLLYRLPYPRDRR
jgi:protein-L-isoaspartate O-methyltransferase